MSNEPRTLELRPLRLAHLIGLLFGVVVLVTLYVFIRPLNDSLANGFLVGGLVAIGGMAIAFWRANKPSATSFERGVSGNADERDKAVGQAAFAFAGKVAVLWISGGVIAIGVGAPAEIASAVMIWGQLLSLVGGWIFYSRKL